jgi:hypothetical protein
VLYRDIDNMSTIDTNRGNGKCKRRTVYNKRLVTCTLTDTTLQNALQSVFMINDTESKNIRGIANEATFSFGLQEDGSFYVDGIDKGTVVTTDADSIYVIFD